MSRKKNIIFAILLALFALLASTSLFYANIKAKEARHHAIIAQENAEKLAKAVEHAAQQADMTAKWRAKFMECQAQWPIL